jgi:alkaline phosphatase
VEIPVLLHVMCFHLQTYCVDSQVADSACSATAYLGGVKGNIGTIGVTGNVKVNDCAAMLNGTNRVTSILEWSQVKSATFLYLVYHEQ